ncbi:MAG: UvrD-helicase domain-containing protein [Thermomicrobia bacterium]|nr:UvrD-helicase domain-containing protein [Thermomicrobia bacterium]
MTTEETILSGLNTQQREAVTTTEGPVLIVAGPGSGKTRVLTHRIAYLLAARHVDPHNVLAVTFTNKAAKEMRDRLERLVGAQVNGLTVGTFHAVCARVLRRDGERVGIAQDFTIYDDADQISVMKNALRDLNLDPKQYGPRTILSTISAAKSNGVAADEFAGLASSYWEEIAGRVYPLYQRLLRLHNALDFDDLLLTTLQLLLTRPDVLDRYQHRYRYIHVDEYQDTNHVQYRLVKELAAKHQNLCVVGDPDQSIYGWRQADIRNILDFERDFPKAKTILLEQNYRSSRRIVDAAQAVISMNTQRKQKQLITANDAGAAISIREHYDEGQEAQFVVQEIQRLVTVGRYHTNDCAVMYRTNAQSRIMEEACIRFGLPYQLIGGTRFYERKEVKDVLALLRLVHNPADGAAFERIIDNTPLGRGIGKQSVAALNAWARAHNTSAIAGCRALVEGMEPLPPVSGRPAAGLGDIARFVAGMRATMLDTSIVTFFDTLIERSGYLRMLEEGGIDEADRVENVNELRSVVAEYETLDPSQALATFLEEAALVSDQDMYNRTADDSEKATLITLHAAKGLEFPVVFIVGAEENILPHSRSQESAAELEEERRLFFVGITRAKERLYISHVFKRTVWGNEQYATRSRFVDSIPPDIIEQTGAAARRLPAASPPQQSATRWEKAPAYGAPGPSPVNGRGGPLETKGTTFRAGDRVSHPKFGDGAVVSVRDLGDDQEVTIAFVGAGVKKLMASLARIEQRR